MKAQDNYAEAYCEYWFSNPSIEPVPEFSIVPLYNVIVNAKENWVTLEKRCQPTPYEDFFDCMGII